MDVEAPANNYPWQPERQKSVFICMADSKTYEDPTVFRLKQFTAIPPPWSLARSAGTMTAPN